MRCPWTAARLWPAVLVGLGLASTAASAQVEVRPELEGRVLLGDAPLFDVWVLLHEVSEDNAGQIDSVRTDREGAFRFSLPTVPDPGGRSEIYFASVRHAGIVYFGPAVDRGVQLDSTYTIQAYDTVAAPEGGAQLPLTARYIILEQEAEGWLVTDLFQIRNDGTRTIVTDSAGATWRHPLPDGASGVRIGAGEVEPEAARVQEGDVLLSMPLSPGERQVVLRYALADLDGVRFPFGFDTDETEVYVREPAPPLEVDGLPALESVEMSPGVDYRRYGGSMPAGAGMTVTELAEASGLPVQGLAVLLALSLAVAGVYAVRRDGSGGPAALATVSPADARPRVLLEIARLDDALEADPSEVERRRLQARRAHLLARLRPEQ